MACGERNSVDAPLIGATHAEIVTRLPATGRRSIATWCARCSWPSGGGRRGRMQANGFWRVGMRWRAWRCAGEFGDGGRQLRDVARRHYGAAPERIELVLTAAGSHAE